MEYYWIIPSNNIHESGEEGLNRRCNKPCFIWCVIIELVNGFYDPVNLECQKNSSIDGKKVYNGGIFKKYTFFRLPNYSVMKRTRHFICAHQNQTPLCQ